MSRTVVILILSWLCIFSVSEAAVGASCNETVECEATIESCIDGSCICSSGYFDVGGKCKSKTITVTLSPSSSSVVYGLEAVLTASVTSDVPVGSIIWQKVSSGTITNLTTNQAKYIQTGDIGSGTVTLTIKSLVFEDKGNYQVEITNNAGTTKTSNQVSIDVTGGTITVTLSPLSSNVVYGSDAVLTATVASNVAVGSIIWQKVSGGTTTNLTTNQAKYIQTGDVGSGTVTLTIKSLVFEDKGNYQVEITNNARTTNTSNQVPINVTGGTISVTLSPSSSSVVYGLDAVLTASVTSDVPVGTIIWQKVSDSTTTNLTTNQAKYIQTGDVGSGTVTLTIKSLVFQDQGSYQVQIINNAGTKKTSNQVPINVTGGTITVTLSPASSSVMYGSDAVLTATVASNVAVGSIIWQKVSGGTTTNLTTNQAKYIQTGDVGSGTVTLTIKSLVFQDQASYQVQIINNAGTTNTSNQVPINVTGGELTVSTGDNVSGKFNGSVTIDCIVSGPELNKIQWIKYVNNVQGNIEIDNTKYTGGSLTTKALTINNLNRNDATEYQCQASNPGGTYESTNRATVTVVYTELAPVITGIVSTTSTFTVSWNHPTTYYNLVSEYEVKWRVTGASQESSLRLNKTMKQHTVSSGLVSGQLYTVYVISHVNFINPPGSIPVKSNDTTIRLVPMPPGPINKSGSIFAHSNLQLTWNAPVNTIITKYEVTLEGLLYVASSNVFTQFNKVFVPGKYYIVSIVTVSGTINEKKSTEHSEWIRITPTKPSPPTNISCPQNPLDISLEISWTAPTEPNGIILSYQINVSPGNPGQISTSSNETHKNVEGLSPEQMYNFTVHTINDAVDSTSEPSQPRICKTKAGVSTAPTNLEINEVQSRGFRIEFNRPDNVNGILAAYKIVISEGGNCVQQILIHEKCSNCNSTLGCPIPINYTVTNITNDVSYNASDLYPYTQYMVKVVAINGNGEGHPVNSTVMTEEEVPPQPGQITANIIENSSLTLSWTLADPSPGNTTYTIYTYEGTDDMGTNFFMKEPTKKVYGFTTKTVSLPGLEEYWPYKFKVDAATVKGNKTSDFSSIFRTKQGAPGQVLNLTIQKKGNDYKSAYVSWSPPAPRDHNGVLQSYLFSNNHTGAMKEEKIPVLLSQAIVERKIPVTPEALYVIKVVLQNNESMESQASMQPYEAPSGPPPVTDIQPVTTTPGEHRPTTNTITININTTYYENNDNGKQVFFGIAVCAKSKCEDKTVMAEITHQHDWKDLPNWHKASKDGFPLYRVTNDTFMDKVRKGDSRRKRSTINASVIKFKIGEDAACPFLNTNVYCNGHLSAGTSYKVIIFACTNGGCTYSEADGSFSTQNIPEKEDNNINIIIGVVVAVVVAAVIVGVAFVVVKRRNRLGETKQYQKGIDNPTAFDEPVPKNIPRKRPIKLKELSDKVADKHKDSNLHFAREYEDLKALSPKHPAETSELDSNKLKNRYVNILPFDHSRVKLMLTEDDDPSTDFINANYLPGYKSQREYIATQGPIPGTIDDFWRMIWEQNVSIIVMLTLCKEEGRVKCEMYWPENIHEPKQYGDLVVETVSNSTVNFYEFRIFKIKLGDTTRSVKHFHFLQWKDFSANVQNDVMIDFIKNVRNHIRPPDMNGPVVVHCSAGVGRTGTYCALDHLFQFVDEHDLDESIDIFDLVMNLRERRMFMVQTEQQYVFIHDCVRDYVERKKKELQGNLLYENVNRGFVADEDPMEESLYQNYSNQRTDL